MEASFDAKLAGEIAPFGVAEQGPAMATVVGPASVVPAVAYGLAAELGFELEIECPAAAAAVLVLDVAAGIYDR